MAKTESAIPLSKFKAFLREISEIASQSDPTDVALIVIDQTCEVLECDRTSFFFVDGEFLDLVIAKGADNIRLPKNSGFAGDCATSGKIVNIADAYQDKRFNDAFDKKSGYHTKQILCCPVLDPNDESVVGVLQAINKKSDSPFDAVEEELLRSIANQVAVALRYAQQTEEARQAAEQRNTLISYIRTMNNATSAASVLYTLNSTTQKLLESDRCTVYIVDHTSQTMHIASADASIDITLPLGQGIAGSVAVSGKIINIVDAYADERFDQTWDKKTGYRTRSMLVMPVWPIKSVDDKKSTTEDKPIAVVQLINKVDDASVFTKDDQEILEVLLRFIAPVLSNSPMFIRKERKNEAQLITDLTKDRLYRQPSMDRIGADIVIEEGDEEEDDDLL